MFECLQRIATMRKLAIEELDFRMGQLALLRAIHAPKSVIENEERLIKRAKKVCSALCVKY